MGNERHLTGCVAVVPSGTTLASPSARDLADLTSVIEAAGVSAIFAETSQPGRLVEALRGRANRGDSSGGEPGTPTSMSPSMNVGALPHTGQRSADLDPGRCHVVLLGLMGAGKSTVGHLVANELGRPFVDSDSIVELRTGHAPPVLVERRGVDHLHAVELDVVHHVLGQRDAVVFAAAASIVDVIDHEDLGAAWCVWLETSPSSLAERILDDRRERPLLDDVPESTLVEQHRRRAPLGRGLAAVSITTDGRTPTEVAQLVCSAWRARCRG